MTDETSHQRVQGPTDALTDGESDPTTGATQRAARHESGEEPIPVAATQPDAHAETDRLEHLDATLAQARRAADEVADAGDVSDEERRAAAERVVPGEPAARPQQGSEVAPG